MDRHRDGDRFGNNQDVHHYNDARHSRAGPPSGNPDNFAPRPRSPSNNHFAGGGNGVGAAGFYGTRDQHRPPFEGSPRYPPESSPRYPSAGSAGVGAPRPIGGGGGGGFMPTHPMPPPLAGQKRGYPFPDTGLPSPDKFDGSSFTKLFVGSVPRTATEEDIRPLFEDHGHVLEVALIRDKRTGQQQGILRGSRGNMSCIPAQLIFPKIFGFWDLGSGCYLSVAFIPTPEDNCKSVYNMMRVSCLV